MTTEAGRRLVAAMPWRNAIEQDQWQALVAAIEAEARAALLAELEAGVEGLRDEGPRIGQRGFDGACAAVLDLIRKAGEK